MGKKSFKLEHPFEKRQAEFARITRTYPGKIPIIVEKAAKSDVPDIDKQRFLVLGQMTVGQLVFLIRKKIMLSAEKAIFIFINDILPPTSSIMAALYQEHKDEDGFLYVTYSGENTFGESSV
ncbi:hypothetical protein K2173_010764 [Erythroxylum novogranatense]|uniref:Autophagy-related protein n=1 Tax=Erythroxylum novogranatense TaxID=1862640 RepID=A0AAV8SRI3_9ROSI|nr:hypothetical protein K2173_010764 [Erythroxylum novogranatense]